MPYARSICFLLASACMLPATAHADLFYSNNFESGILGPEWGHTARIDQGTNFTKFLGRYSENTPQVLNNSVSLALSRPTDDTGNPGNPGTPGGSPGTPPTIYTMLFDFYCIDSWHGNDSSSGPDKFELYINGANTFSYTFSNTTAPQTYHAPTVGPAQLGFGSPALDSIYRDVRVDFDPGTAAEFVFKWRSDGLTGINNESWGIDNVRVSYTIPTPGSLALLGLGGFALAKRRR